MRAPNRVERQIRESILTCGIRYYSVVSLLTPYDGQCPRPHPHTHTTRSDYTTLSSTLSTHSRTRTTHGSLSSTLHHNISNLVLPFTLPNILGPQANAFFSPGRDMAELDVLT